MKPVVPAVFRYHRLRAHGLPQLFAETECGCLPACGERVIALNVKLVDLIANVIILVVEFVPNFVLKFRIVRNGTLLYALGVTKTVVCSSSFAQVAGLWQRYFLPLSRSRHTIKAKHRVQ